MAPGAIIEHTNNIELFNKNNLDNINTITGINIDHGFNKIDGKQLVLKTLKERIATIDPATCEPGDEDAFFVADMGEVYRQQIRWKMNLGRVKPHYAVKCNPDVQVIRLLAALGCGFDCASKAEIDLVLNEGVEPHRIIFAQPCKTRSYIRHAINEGVTQMTFDNADELYKIKNLFGSKAHIPELYLRILTDDSSSLCRLSQKFGASLSTAKDLLVLAKDLDLTVVGVSFHVGSGASDPQAFRQAVHDSRLVFDYAEALGFKMHTLDVGGGFMSELFEEMAAVLSSALDEYFPSPSVRIISEPGRYFVANAYTLACNVVARRDYMDANRTRYMLYLNDGVYGNFSSIIFDHQHPVPQILSCHNHNPSPEVDSESHIVQIEYSLWGPTCDGIDKITESAMFNAQLDVGDWLFFEEMGAYTKCSATRFNGFTDDHKVVYVSSEAGAKAILQL